MNWIEIELQGSPLRPKIRCRECRCWRRWQLCSSVPCAENFRITQGSGKSFSTTTMISTQKVGNSVGTPVILKENVFRSFYVQLWRYSSGRSGPTPQQHTTFSQDPTIYRAGKKYIQQWYQQDHGIKCHGADKKPPHAPIEC